MEPTFSHRPVMLSECIEALNIRHDGIYADCTAGGGGHSYEIARLLGENGHLYAVDRDESAVAAAGEKLACFGGRVTVIHDNFLNIKAILDGRKLDGALIDLGVSSYQLDTPERGFSYMQDAPLDMRMNRDDILTAAEVVNNYSADELTRIIYAYGEERFAPRIVSAIISARPIKTTLELAMIIKSAIPAKAREGGHHPAKRTFQAIRIEVNRELEAIGPVLLDITDSLKPAGRIAVITFHSLEDRIVKQTFAGLTGGCVCPPAFPVCVCGKKPVLKLVGRKPILPSENELAENPRARSAKLRTAEHV
ncbi:MAG: 16S rRNA (cytosine(1402)-N(4))-methyltransferase RsmH [Eubacteriales bacterium]